MSGFGGCIWGSAGPAWVSAGLHEPQLHQAVPAGANHVMFFGSDFQSGKEVVGQEWGWTPCASTLSPHPAEGPRGGDTCPASDAASPLLGLTYQG